MKLKNLITCFICTFIIVNILSAQDIKEGKLLIELKIQGVSEAKYLSELGLNIVFMDTTTYTCSQYKRYLGQDSIYFHCFESLNIPINIRETTKTIILDGREYLIRLGVRQDIIVNTSLTVTSNKKNIHWMTGMICTYPNLNLTNIFNDSTRVEVSMKKESNNKKEIRVTLSFFQNDKKISYCHYYVSDTLMPRKVRKEILKKLKEEPPEEYFFDIGN
jgi:hypothetical protein